VPVSIGGGDVHGGDSSATQDLKNKADSTAKNDADTNQFAIQKQIDGCGCDEKDGHKDAGKGGSGQAQKLEQNANTVQKADSDAKAKQDAVNVNAPISISDGKKDHGKKDDGKKDDGKKDDGKDDYGKDYGKEYEKGDHEDNHDGDHKGGDSSADQTLENKAESKAKNDAETKQGAIQFQESGSDCSKGCGGSGQAQKLEQNANTEQKAFSDADAYQDALNVNVPVTIGGGKKGKDGGDSSATQDLKNKADSTAKNDAETNQFAIQKQLAGCGCDDKDGHKDAGNGGSGQAQWLEQNANTEQKADSEANAYQDAVNVNVPISISDGDHKKGHDCGCSNGDHKGGGDSSADQTLENKAESKATNDAETNQFAIQFQDSGCGCDHKDGHKDAGNGGSGQAQGLVQNANTVQKAKSKAKAKQKAVNVNVPVKVKKGHKGHKGDHPKPWKGRE
jgi:hypothetical protein